MTTEQEFEPELIPWEMPETLDQAEEAYKKTLAEAAAISPFVEREAWRRLGREDLFFLGVFILNRKDMMHPWVYERCREVQNEKNSCLDLWAREHFKSTIITFILTIQDILNDPEVTIGLFSNTRPLAQQFLRQIKTELEDNGHLKSLYDEILWSDPEKMAKKWSEHEGIIVKRKGNPKEATVEAWGLIDNQPTSKHFQVRVYDDVVTQDSIQNPETIKKTTERWELSINLGTENGHERYAGTTYHANDTYQEIMRRGIVKARIHPATHNGKPDGDSVLFSQENLLKKARSMGVYTFGTQMLLDPKGNSTKSFKPEWLRFWIPKRQGLNVIIIVDPASGKKRYRGGRIQNDYTSMIALGVDGNLNWMVLKVIRDRLNLKGRSDALFALHREMRPVLGTYYEEYGLQADIEHIQLEQERENYRFDITPLGGNLPKGDVIESAIPKWMAGEIYLPETQMIINSEGLSEDVIKTFIVEEFNLYPVAKHDDTLNVIGLASHKDVRLVAPGVDFTKIAASRARRAERRGRGVMGL